MGGMVAVFILPLYCNCNPSQGAKHQRLKINICPRCFVTLIALILFLRAGSENSRSAVTRDGFQMILKKLNITCEPDKPKAAIASTSKVLVCIACVGQSATLGKPSGSRRPRNAASRQTTGKPCAGRLGVLPNPHARFERGRWLSNRPSRLLESQRLPMTRPTRSAP